VGKLASELNSIVDAINDKEQEFEKLSDEEIKTNFQNLVRSTEQTTLKY
jgi:preprotein translocase subunit SecA